MKYMAKNLFFLILLLLPMSCNDWLDLQPPQGLIREEFWKTKEDVEAVVMGAYASFAELDERLFKYGEMRADMVFVDYNASWNEREINKSNIYTDNWFCDWSSLYKVINYCNEVIYNAPLVQEVDLTFTDFIRDGYLSEVYFLRSLAYFYLVRVYKDVPYITLPTETDDSEIFIPKTEGTEILEDLREDLLDIRVGATRDGYISLTESKGRVTKSAIDALLADISLWLFDYEDVLTYTNNVLNPPDIEGGLAQYKLEDTDWFTIFYPGNSSEGIFEFQFDDALNQSNSMWGTTWQDNHNYYPSEKAVDLFLTDDIRGDTYSIDEYDEDRYMIWKYIGRESNVQRPGSEEGSANWIVYRLSEIYLMRAEALTQLGRFGEARALLSDYILLRDTDSFNDVADTPNSWEDAILLERSLELAFEGKRWFDLVRMGSRNNYARKSKLVEIIIQNVTSTQKRILSIKLTNPEGWYLPIHEREIERNNKLVQNPYYDN